MAKRGFLARHDIVRNAIREDLLYFAIPAVFVLFAGMGVSALHQYKTLSDWPFYRRWIDN